MPKKPLIIIKLGGSLITEKDKSYTLREGYFERFAEEFKVVLAEFPETKFILLNGAGSFGHQDVFKYGLKDGFKDKNSPFGYAKILQNTDKLNRFLVDSLLEKNIPAIQFQPSTLFISETKKIKTYNSSNLETLEMFLDKEILPCLHGEMILDKIVGCSVLSGDKIPLLLGKFFQKSENYKLEKVINLGNYDGVLDSKNQVIGQITPSNFKDIQKHLYQSNLVDVSGGMINKIQEFLELTSFDISGVILNGLTENILLKYLKNETVKCTEIIKNP